jgi:hypothetical protein
MGPGAPIGRLERRRRHDDLGVAATARDAGPSLPTGRRSPAGCSIAWRWWPRSAPAPPRPVGRVAACRDSWHRYQSGSLPVPVWPLPASSCGAAWSPTTPNVRGAATRAPAVKTAASRAAHGRRIRPDISGFFHGGHLPPPLLRSSHQPWMDPHPTGTAAPNAGHAQATTDPGCSLRRDGRRPAPRNRSGGLGLRPLLGRTRAAPQRRVQWRALRRSQPERRRRRYAIALITRRPAPRPVDRGAARWWAVSRRVALSALKAEREQEGQR